MKHFNSSRFITIGFVFLFLIVIISGVAFAEEGRNKIEIAGDVFQAAGEEKPVLEAEPTPSVPMRTSGEASTLSVSSSVTVTLGAWRNLRPTESYLRDVSLLPPKYDVDCTSPDQKSKGWIVGYNGVILSYCNGVWDHAIIVESIPTNLFGVQAVSPNLSVAVGDQGAVLMYLWDSTAQDWVWTKSPIPVGNNRLYAVSIVEDGEGGYTAWAVGEKDDNGFGTLVKGTITPTAVDGKASYTYTWKNVTAQYPELPQVDYYYSVQMLSPSEGWIVGGVDGEKAVILHWDGNDWSVDQEVGNDSLRGIFMLSAIEGWTVGRGGAIFYFDGTNWSAVSSPTSSMLLDVSFNKDGEGWALGFDGMLLQYKNSYWSIFDDLRSDPFDFVALDFTSNQGWLVGYHAEKSIGGQILEYDEGLWLTVSPPTDSRLNDVSVISDSDAWAVGMADGAGGNIIHWDGKHWQRWYQDDLPIPSIDLYAVKMVSATDGWASGDPPAYGEPALFLRWDGHRWYQPRFDAPINVRVNAIDLLDGKLGIKFGGWAVADNGNAVAKWDGAVDYWSALHACYGTYYRMRDTSIVTSTVGIFEWDAWAVGTSWPDSSPKQADYFLRYMDGCSTGYAWQAFQSPRACEPDKDDGPKETYLHGIQMMPGSWGYAVGNYKDRASIYSYDESSGSWSTDWCEPGDSDYRPSRLYTAAIVEESGVGWFGGFYTSPVTKRKVADIRFNDALGLHWGVTPFPINGRNIYHRPILRMDMSSDTMGWAVGDGEDSGKISVIYQYPYPNFTLDLTPDARALIPGNTTTFTVTVNSIGGFSADVSLSVSNLPEGISVDIDPDTVNEGTSGIITVQTSPTTTLGTYEIPLLGYTTFRSGDNDIPVWRTTYLLLTVTNTPVYTVSPSSGPAGTDVTIKGENFGPDPGAGNRSTAANHVILAGQQMPNGSILSWSDTQIEVDVPDDASLFPRGPEYGEVSVTAGGSKSNTDFSFQLENYIEDISMQVDGDEIVVDLTGTSFGDDPGGQLRSTSYEHVALSDEWLPTNDVLTWSNNTVQFTVHISTTSGLVAVTSNGFESNSVLFDNPVIERESYDVYLPLTIND